MEVGKSTNGETQYIILSETKSSPKEAADIVGDMYPLESLEESCNKKKGRSLGQCNIHIIKDIICVMPKLLSNVAVFDLPASKKKKGETKTDSGLPYHTMEVDTTNFINIFSIKDIIDNLGTLSRKIIFADPVNKFMLRNGFMRYSTGIEKKNYCTRNKYDFDKHTKECTDLCQSHLIGEHKNLDSLSEEEQSAAMYNPDKIWREDEERWIKFRKRYIESYNCEHIFNNSRFKSYIYDELIKYTGTRDKLLRYPDDVCNDIIKKNNKISYFNYSKKNPFDSAKKAGLYNGTHTKLLPDESGRTILNWKKEFNKCTTRWRRGGEGGEKEHTLCGENTLNVIHVAAPAYELKIHPGSGGNKYVTKSMDKQATIDCYVSLFKEYCVLVNDIEDGVPKDLTLIIPILADYLNQKFSTSDLMYFNKNDKHEDYTINYIMESLVLLDPIERNTIIQSIEKKKIILYLGGHLKGVQQTSNTIRVTSLPPNSATPAVKKLADMTSFKLDLKKDMIDNFIKIYIDNDKHWKIGKKLLEQKK